MYSVNAVVFSCKKKEDRFEIKGKISPQKKLGFLHRQTSNYVNFQFGPSPYVTIFIAVSAVICHLSFDVVGWGVYEFLLFVCFFFSLLLFACVDIWNYFKKQTPNHAMTLYHLISSYCLHFLAQPKKSTPNQIDLILFSTFFLLLFQSNSAMICFPLLFFSLLALTTSNHIWC